MQIKIRAWDPIAKQMHYSEQEQFDDMLGFRFKHFECDEPVYQLWTGRNDRNGKEIYEGDIFENDREDTHEIVIFEEDSFWSEGSTYTSPLHEVNTRSKEVIGNIFENPELLEVTE